MKLLCCTLPFAFSVLSLRLKPNRVTVKAYYEALGQFGQLYIDHEGAVRSAFQGRLAKCGQRANPKLTLVPEYRIARVKKYSVVVDGALLDLYHLPHGYWEAKDEKDLSDSCAIVSPYARACVGSAYDSPLISAMNYVQAVTASGTGAL